MSIPGKSRESMGRNQGSRRVVPLRFERPVQREALEAAPLAEGFPPMSITQDEDNLYLRAEVPGIQPGELSISTDWRGVSLAGKRRLGFFDCTVALPAAVDAERADAGYCNGILTLTLPKARDGKPVLS